MAKGMKKGGLLIRCRDEERREKAMKQKVCNMVHEKAKKTSDGPSVMGLYGISMAERV